MNDMRLFVNLLMNTLGVQATIEILTASIVDLVEEVEVLEAENDELYNIIDLQDEALYGEEDDEDDFEDCMGKCGCCNCYADTEKVSSKIKPEVADALAKYIRDYFEDEDTTW